MVIQIFTRLNHQVPD